MPTRVSIGRMRATPHVTLGVMGGCYRVGRRDMVARDIGGRRNDNDLQERCKNRTRLPIFSARGIYCSHGKKVHKFKSLSPPRNTGRRENFWENKCVWRGGTDRVLTGPVFRFLSLNRRPRGTEITELQRCQRSEARRGEVKFSRRCEATPASPRSPPFEARMASHRFDSGNSKSPRLDGISAELRHTKWTNFMTHRR